MSYGRRPYYIYQGEWTNGERYFHFFDQDDNHITYDAMAQFVASMWSRDNSDITLVDGELRELIERGKELRPKLDSWIREREAAQARGVHVKESE